MNFRPCPRCLKGQVLGNYPGDSSCLQCGYQVPEPQTPLEIPSRKREPRLTGEPSAKERELGLAGVAR